MNKWKIAGVVLLGFLVLAIIGALSNNDKTTTITNVTTSTTAGQTLSYSSCENTGTHLGELWTQYQKALEQAVRSGQADDPEIVSAAAEAGHKLISASRSWVNLCSGYFPEESAHISALLDEIEPVVNQLG